MQEEPNKNNNKNNKKNKCPKNFGLWAAFVLGMGCMVITIALIDYLQRGRARGGEETSQYEIQKVAGSGPIPESLEKSSISTAWLGIEIQEIDETIAGRLGLSNNDSIIVNKVIEGSPADNGGIERGDVIVRFDHKSLEGVSDLQNLIANLSPDQRVRIDVIRNGLRKSLYVKLGATPTNDIHTVSMEENVLQWGMAVSELTEPIALAFGIQGGEEGVVVIRIIPDARAALAGLQPGDLIMGVNSLPTPDMATFLSAIRDAQETVFYISRGSENFYLVAEDSEKPGLPG